MNPALEGEINIRDINALEFSQVEMQAHVVTFEPAEVRMMLI